MILISDKERLKDDINNAVNSAKQRGDSVFGITIADYYIICKTPSKRSVAKWEKATMDRTTKASKKASSHRDLVIENIVYPSIEQTNKVFDEYPGFVATIFSELMDKVGYGEEAFIEEL